MRATRLLLLTEYFAPHAGGTAVYYYEILRRLTGMEITVVTRAHPDAADFDRLQSLQIVRTPFPRIPKVRMVVEWWAQFLVGLWMVFTRRIDVIHAGQVFPGGLAVYSIHVLSGAPYAVYIHGEEVTLATRRWWKRLVVGFVLRRANAVFVNSRFSSRQVLELGVQRSRIHVVYPGVDSDRFRPDADSPRHTWLRGDGEHVLLSVGRLIPRKGLDTMIRLLPRVAAAVPDVVYWIAGGGAQSERQRMEQLAAATGVSDRVRFLGEVPGEDLPGLFKACEIFVMLNRTTSDGDVEGFGIVFLEAGACGKPVVGGRSGGAVEAVKDARTGLLISSEDADAAVEAIVRLLRDAALRNRLGEAGRRRAIRHFSWDRAARRVGQVTAQLACRTRTGGEKIESEVGRVPAS